MNKTLPKEVWKFVPEYPHYKVSNLGRIRSVLGERPQLLKGCINNCGYLRVTFWNEGKQKCLLVHRLIMLAFVGPCPDGHQVAHYDGDKLNNQLSNLRYATPMENRHDTLRIGRFNNGEKNGKSKLTERDVKEIIHLLSEDSLSRKEIGRKFDVSHQTITDIFLQRRWKYLFRR